MRNVRSFLDHRVNNKSSFKEHPAESFPTSSTVIFLQNADVKSTSLYCFFFQIILR